MAAFIFEWSPLPTAAFFMLALTADWWPQRLRFRAANIFFGILQFLGFFGFQAVEARHRAQGGRLLGRRVTHNAAKQIRGDDPVVPAFEAMPQRAPMTEPRQTISAAAM